MYYLYEFFLDLTDTFFKCVEYGLSGQIQSIISNKT